MESVGLDPMELTPAKKPGRQILLGGADFHPSEVPTAGGAAHATVRVMMDGGQ